MATTSNIQKAIVAALKADNAVKAIVSTRVHDGYQPGETSTYPRINVTWLASGPKSRSTAQDHFFRVSCFDDDRDVLATINLANAVRDVLHDTQLLATGYRCLWIQETDFRVVGVDPSGVAHSASDYRVSVSENAN